MDGKGVIDMRIYDNGIYRDMTEEEINATKVELPPELRIADLKQNLADTDYKIIKMAEGESTLEECSEIIALRKAWRKEINELEERTGKGDG